MSLSPDTSDPSVLDPSKRITPSLEADEKDVISRGAHVAWSAASAGWLYLIAIPLTFFPRVLNLIFGSLLTEMNKPQALEGTAPEATIRTLNALERSLAHFAGICCFALGSLIVIQSGAIPLTSSLSAHQGVAQSQSAAPFRQPTIFLTTVFFSVLAWQSYDLNMKVAAAPSAALSVHGLWVLLFAHQGRVNKAGKGASSFPFKNAAAEKEKAKKAL
ncbi:uncharacterized protein JCM6883_002453 [Sporobolomyces salmoneus]|uniref:uncharacterized protein n=1 Tax=Sporobolomyces salmoneus TaxID=183962 RepID=UPI00317BB397